MLVAVAGGRTEREREQKHMSARMCVARCANAHSTLDKRSASNLSNSISQRKIAHPAKLAPQTICIRSLASIISRVGTRLLWRRLLNANGNVRVFRGNYGNTEV